MDFYQTNLGIFVAANAYLLWSQYRTTKKYDALAPVDLASVEDDESAAKRGTRARIFQLRFFLPYVLAVAADWFQGPHIYAIYKYEKAIAEKTVAALYAAGFVSGGISASFAGGFADRFGRKRACMLYCALYAVTCLAMLSDSLPILFLGRFAGGICTTLLFSVFEAWMISDYHEQGLPASELALGSIFSTMTTLSCVVAIICGIIGDILVQASGTRTSPFMAAVVCCLGAGLLISRNWRENFGARSSEQTSWHLLTTVRDIIRDPKILSLSLTSCVFEGTMYLFIFFWSAALKSARVASGSTEDLPFGIIFSSFMCAMMAGSTLFTLVNADPKTIHSSADMLLNLTLFVSCCQGLAVVLRDERLIFWVFCLLEGCIGAYFPTMAFLKSELVEDRIRGRVYSVLRLPLNVFVVVAHSLDKEGDFHRNNVFLVCGSLLLAVALFARRHFSQ